MVWYEHLVEGDIHTACPLESHHIPVVAEGYVINADGGEARRGVLLRLDSRKKKPFSVGGATGVPIVPTQFDTTVDDIEGARRRRNCATSRLLVTQTPLRDGQALTTQAQRASVEQS